MKTLYLITLATIVSCTQFAAQTPSQTTVIADKKSSSPIELGLRTSDKEWLDLNMLRGKPTLLFLFATFDGSSQIALTPLRLFMQDFDDIQVIGIAVQPKAERLLKAWSYALDPPFIVGADPYGRVEDGLSALGKIETVPTYILLDAKGYERARVHGIQNETQLIELTNRVRSRPVIR